jgi:acyl-CoA synthetase (AMP-forming)/AMP-acid ligase II/acyl carrier protein
MPRPGSALLAPIAHYIELNPQAAALIDPNGMVLSHQELWSQIEACRLRLEEAGISPEEIVAVLVPQGALQMIAVTGVMSHCACAPLQPRTTVAEVTSLLRRLGASALITSPEFDAESRAAEAEGLTVFWARAEQSPSEWKIRRAASPVQLRNARSDAKLIFATSATTSTPKLAPLSERNLEAGTAPRRSSLRLTAADRLLLMTSLSHITGVENALAQLQCGGTVIATGGFEPAAYLGWLRSLKPTWYACAPTVHQAALVQLLREPLDSPVSLRFIQSAGAALPDNVRQRLEQILQIPVFNDYGMTEACPIAFDAFLPGGRVANSAGRSCGLEIRIVGPTGEPAAPGVEGEITVRGPAVFSGYLDDPDASRAAFQDGWFKTGDLGHLDGDGNLFVTGRRKEMINRGGEKVAPSEVDAVIASHPAVLEAAAFAVPHPTLGEDVACAVVLRTSVESPLSVGELRRFAASQLARFKVPNRIYFVDEIPRGELGKPQRWVLAERLGSKRSALPSPAEMTDHASDVVFYRSYEIWARILDRDDLGFNENFFDAGGDSLAAINMLAEVDQRFGSQTSAMAASFLDDPTLAHLVELVGKAALPRPSENATSDIRVFPVREESSPRRLFCIPADGDEGLYFRRLATYLRGQMDLFIVRPANAWFAQSLFTFEQAGATTAKLIRQVQPEGEYLVGGYCSGGVVAIEATRCLIREGQDVRLVLFDAYMPGFPSPLRGWRAWLESARCQWHARGGPDNENYALNPGYVAKRVAWSAVTPFRRSLVPVERFATVKWLLRQILKGNLPFYEAHPIDAPILHFLCTNESNVIDRTSRFGWRAMACGGIEEQYTAFDHMNVFHESNLPKIVDTLLRWAGARQSVRESKGGEGWLHKSHQVGRKTSLRG